MLNWSEIIKRWPLTVGGAGGSGLMWFFNFIGYKIPAGWGYFLGFVFLCMFVIGSHFLCSDLINWMVKKEKIKDANKKTFLCAARIVLGLFSLVVFVLAINQIILKKEEKNSAPPPPSASEVLNLLDEILKIKNGDFEKGYSDWLSSENPPRFSFVSDDNLFVNADSGQHIMSIKEGMGHSLSKGLIIECSKQPGSNEYPSFRQTMEGLEPDAKYKINFFLYLGEHKSVTEDSLYIALGTPWQIKPGEEGKIFSKKIEGNGWTEQSITLANHADTKADLWIVVNDIAHDIRLDDITIKKA